MCIFMFIAAWFIIAKSWKWPIYPIIDNEKRYCGICKNIVLAIKRINFCHLLENECTLRT